MKKFFPELCAVYGCTRAYIREIARQKLPSAAAEDDFPNMRQTFAARVARSQEVPLCEDFLIEYAAKSIYSASAIQRRSLQLW